MSQLHQVVWQALRTFCDAECQKNCTCRSCYLSQQAAFGMLMRTQSHAATPSVWITSAAAKSEANAMSWHCRKLQTSFDISFLPTCAGFKRFIYPSPQVSIQSTQGITVLFHFPAAIPCPILSWTSHRPVSIFDPWAWSYHGRWPSSLGLPLG